MPTLNVAARRDAPPRPTNVDVRLRLLGSVRGFPPHVPFSAAQDVLRCFTLVAQLSQPAKISHTLCCGVQPLRAKFHTLSTDFLGKPSIAPPTAVFRLLSVARAELSYGQPTLQKKPILRVL